MCIAVQSGLIMVPAIAYKRLVDYLGHGNGSFTQIVILVGSALAASFGKGLIGVAELLLTEQISQGIVRTLRQSLFGRLLAQPVAFFADRPSGEVMSRFGNDVGAVQNVITSTVIGLVRNTLISVTTLVLMLTFSWKLTLLTVLLVPAVGLPARRFGRLTYGVRRDVQRSAARMTSYLQEVLSVSGIVLVKTFVRGPDEQRRFGAMVDELRALQIRTALTGRWFAMWNDNLNQIGPALLVLCGSYLVLTGQSTVGTVFVFATVLGGQFTGAMSKVAAMYVDVAGAMAPFERIFELLDRRPEVVDAPDARELPAVQGAIRFEEITFSYEGAARPAVIGFTAEIPTGAVVALVGHSGAGKTTLANLLLRFADPQAGRVLIDGHDLREITMASLNRHIGAVFQETFLFHASLRDNLLYARPDASDEVLTAAVRAACLEDVLAALPDGLDTVVGERGHRLSGGERQRVTIARVILKDPRILLLDEATSHLDALAEQRVQAALRLLMRGRTSLVIAHRLSTVLAADQILVLDHGRLVEQGTHAALLARGGRYAQLCRAQFADHRGIRSPAPEKHPSLGFPAKQINRRASKDSDPA
ncbi:putative ABC transporter ATP-binding protein [Actinomadura sp. RB99]|uniref:ABC transporter transmembrane domain-containing protein n=1 Tax=Actinomadura sp. RB99 TaxID=2691577 RepID=UPI001683DCBC|nr:putative ABC transporter ATP-binding protein [Actinomadura sp. RB99]